MSAPFSSYSLKNEKDLFKAALKQPLTYPSKWQLLSITWIEKWKLYVNFDDEMEERSDEEIASLYPGPIDNSDLRGDSEDELRGDVSPNDYVLLPEFTYSVLLKHYGGGPQFLREAVDIGSKYRPVIQVSLFRVKVVAYFCTKQNPDPHLNSTESNTFIRYFDKSCTLESVISSICETQKLQYFGISSAHRCWLKSDTVDESDECSTGSTRMLTTEVTDVVDGWECIRKTPSATIFDVLGDRPSVEMLVESCMYSIAVESDWPRCEHLSRWRKTLRVGDSIDVKDSDGKWEEAVIKNIHIDTGIITVHFKAWSAKFDERIQAYDIASRTAPLYSETSDRRQWSAGNFVEINVSNADAGEAPVWLPVKIKEVDIPGQKIQVTYRETERVKARKHFLGASTTATSSMVETEAETDGDDTAGSQPDDVIKSNGGQVEAWFNLYSEKVCAQFTHTKRTITAAALSTSEPASLYKPGGHSLYSSSSYDSSYSFDKHARGTPMVDGAVGLQNLGNTCFMNSILQCVSNSEHLSKLFVSGAYKSEINADNPLGHGGKLALSFGSLMTDMWSNNYTKVVPRDFKRTIGEFQPQFAGYDQQDSQEFLGFLLDGLHEDLNRVQKKPHVTKIESKGRPDHLIAAESWRRFLLRNDSALVEKCYGQLKSHVTCTNCKTESVTFDEFNSLSLPLPVKNTRTIPVCVQLLPLGSVPVKFDLEVDVSSVMREFKKTFIEKLVSYGLAPLLSADLADDGGEQDSKRARIDNAHFHFSSTYTMKSSGINKTFDPSDTSALNTATTSFFGKYDTCIAFQLQHDTPVYKAPTSYYNSASYSGLGAATTASADTSTSSYRIVDIYSGYTQKTTYNYDRLEIVGTPTRVSVPVEGFRNRMIHDMAWQISRRFIKESSPYISSENDSRPYRIGITNQYTSSIKGYLELSDDELELPRNESVVILWNADARTEEHFEFDLLGKFRSLTEVSISDVSPSKSKMDIYACFDKFCEREQLAEAETLYCSNCKQHLAPIKKMDVWSAPDMLVLQLKRFQYIPGQYFVHREKINELIDFPVEGLDLTKYIKGPKDDIAPAVYDLYAVSQHSGGLGGGHYTAICKNFKDGSWYSFNDSHVSRADASSAVDSSAYVLFYKRRHGSLKWSGVVPSSEPMSDE